ncbi:MAG: hypothetical protein U1E70_17745 [Acetobacteraceae bacterium]|nr:hypothetical protein [Pseudomonadota bacterium]
MTNPFLKYGLIGLAVLLLVIVLAYALIQRRLRKDARIIQDAEELKSVDLSMVITSHVPMEQRTNNPAEEIALAKDAVARRLQGVKRGLQVSAALFVVLAAADLWLFYPRPEVVAPTLRQTNVGVAPPTVDALAAATGRWGWRFNALLSCQENPHTISLSADKRRLSVRFKTAIQGRNGLITGYDYDIVQVAPNELVLKLVDASNRTDSIGKPIEWKIHFEDQNTYYLRRSDVATQDTGIITRCT